MEERIVSGNELAPMHHDVYLDKADLQASFESTSTLRTRKKYLVSIIATHV